MKPNLEGTAFELPRVRGRLDCVDDDRFAMLDA